MGGKNYIPQAELAFKAFAVNFNARVVDKGDVFSIPQLAKSILFTNLGNYLEYQLKIEGGEKDKATVAQRNHYHGILEKDIRNIVNQYIRNNPAATPELLLEFGLHVPDKTKTPVPVPAESPVLEIDFSKSKEHLIYYGSKDLSSKKKIQRRKPKGVVGVEIIFLVGEKMPTDYDLMKPLALDTSSPYRVTYELHQVGQRAYYAACWYNTKGERGPWSEIVSALIN